MTSSSSDCRERLTGPFDLSETPIHLDSEVSSHHSAVPLLDFGFDGPAFEAYIAKHCRSGAPGRLIMVESSSEDWSFWECHTAGDEVVLVLEGEAQFIQEIRGEERRAAVGPGSTMINPAGVWHTADVNKPLKAVYMTPCPGTQHRPR